MGYATRKVDRTAPHTKDSVVKFPWPPATSALLADCLRVQDPDTTNVKFLSLMRGLAYLSQAERAVANAAAHNCNSVKLKRRLGTIARSLSALRRKYPLTLVR